MSYLEPTRPVWLRHPLLCLLLAHLLLAAVRISGPSDFHVGDQGKQADYIFDLALHDRWIVQYHLDGTTMTKPPLYNWLAAPAVLLFGPSELLLKLPSLLAGFLLLAALWDLGRRVMSERAALLGALFLAFSTFFAKQLYFARTDMLLTLLMAAQFWALVRWEENGGTGPSWRNGWLWAFWSAAALGLLAKGPIALLPHLGLAAWWFWERRLLQRYSALGLWWGLPLAFAPMAVWFGLAAAIEPQVWERMVVGEIWARFQEGSSKAHETRHFFYYWPWVMSRLLPWSPLAVLALFLLPWKRPEKESAPNETEAAGARLRERGVLLAAFWFLTILLFFSLVPSKRSDRIFPAAPPFCLLAGWAFVRFTERRREGGATTRSAKALDGLMWILLAAAGALSLCGAALLGATQTAWGAELLKPSLMQAVKLNLLPAWLFTLGLLAAAGVVWAGRLRRREDLLLFGWCAWALLGIALYNHVLCESAETRLSRDAEEMGRWVREAVEREGPEGAEVLVLKGYPRPLRIYLRRHEAPLAPEEAAKRLSASSRVCYVLGTLSFRKQDQVVPGTLEQAGLAGPGALRGAVVVKAVEGGFVPPDQRLAVARCP